MREEAFESIFLGMGAGGTPYHAERSRAGVLRYFQSGFVPVVLWRPAKATRARLVSTHE